MAERRAGQGRRGRSGGISASPAIRTAVNIALAGLDFRPYLHTTDSTERMVEALVAEGVAERREHDHDIDQQNLANRISAGVNRGVVPALQQTLTNIARAMRG